MMSLASLKKLVNLKRDVTGGFLSDLESLRSQNAARQRDLAAVEDLAVPPDAAKASMHRWLDSLVTRGMFSVTRFSTGRAGDWPVINEANAPQVLPALMAAAMRDGLSDYLEAAIEDDYEGRAYGTDAERARRKEELVAEIRALEIAEERLIRSGESAGVPILRRGDASPEIVIATDADLEI